MESWATLLDKESPILMYRGSVQPDVALVQAFQDQSAIGWEHMHWAGLASTGA